MKAKVTIKSTKPTRENLKRFYDVCNNIFHSSDLFYTTSEINKRKKDKKNIFI